MELVVDRVVRQNFNHGHFFDHSCDPCSSFVRSVTAADPFFFSSMLSVDRVVCVDPLLLLVWLVGWLMLRIVSPELEFFLFFLFLSVDRSFGVPDRSFLLVLAVGRSR